MNRRGIFKSLLSAPLLAAGLGSKESKSIELTGNEECSKGRSSSKFCYRGWTAHWTGWKQDISTDDLVAQWCAYKLPVKTEGLHLYVSNPGNWGHYYSGLTFDLIRHIDQTRVTDQTPPFACMAVREEMRGAIMKLIRHAEENQWYDNHPLYGCAMPVVNPEVEGNDRCHWKRLTPPTIAQIQKKEAEGHARNQFGFTGFKDAGQYAYAGNLSVPVNALIQKEPWLPR